jgi:hypothetical protein
MRSLKLIATLLVFMSGVVLVSRARLTQVGGLSAADAHHGSTHAMQCDELLCPKGTPLVRSSRRAISFAKCCCSASKASLALLCLACSSRSCACISASFCFSFLSASAPLMDTGCIDGRCRSRTYIAVEITKSPVNRIFCRASHVSSRSRT